ncbi:hypothetical protein B7R78_0018935 [Ralstonia solanacearum]|uniref:hypothetical protein n=1 Tax=Ralstonia solanacearum species complex TaxID=3116862 RepID=UPI0015E89594|nr:hypothetical protein [Ralstonia solanacearum]MBT1539092.1 hypothetical protein [Ralstonia solanacearum]
MMIFDRDRYDQFFKGFTVFDCAIGYDNTRYCFVLVEQTESPHRDPLPRTRFLFVRTERSVERRFYFQEFGHFDFTRVAFAEAATTPEFVAVDMEGHTFSYNGTAADEEVPGVDTRWLDGKRRAGLMTVKRVNGEILAIGSDRFVFRRIGPKNWQELPGLARPTERLDESAYPLDFGFADVDAFSKDDLYAVGGAGDVWHYDGQGWTQLPFPSNELLYTVCCAGDGNVYITGNMGSLWVGRKDRWKRLAQGTFSVPFKDTAWFAGRLWCGSDYGLWVLQDGKLEVPDQPAEVRTACGVIDISPDGLTMLTASPHGAALYDGDKWELLFSSSAFAEPSKKASERQQLGRGGERLTTHDGMQALLDVIGNDGPEASLQALADPAKLDLPALRAHSWLLLVNAISAQSGWAEYNQVVNRLIELGADPDAVEQESGLTPRALAQSMGLPLA